MSDVKTYATRDDAMRAEVIEPLGMSARFYDVLSIAGHVLGDYSQGFACQVTPDEFWAIAQEYDLENDCQACEGYGTRLTDADDGDGRITSETCRSCDGTGLRDQDLHE